MIERICKGMESRRGGLGKEKHKKSLGNEEGKVLDKQKFFIYKKNYKR